MVLPQQPFGDDLLRTNSLIFHQLKDALEQAVINDLLHNAANSMYLHWNNKGSLTYRFCPRETSYVRFSGGPPPPLETSHIVIDILFFNIVHIR
jgi:hypothetical protein